MKNYPNENTKESIESRMSTGEIEFITQFIANLLIVSVLIAVIGYITY